MSQQINLYNAAFIPPRQWLTGSSLVLGCGVLLALVVGTGVWAHQRSERRSAELAAAKSDLQAVKIRVDALRAQLDARQADPDLTRQVVSLKDRIAQRELLIGLSTSALGEPGLGYTSYLQGLARNASPGIWLTALAVGDRGDSIALSGRATRKELVPEYVKRLNAEAAFRGKSFGGVRIELPSETTDAGKVPDPGKGEPASSAAYAFELLAAGAAPSATESRK